MIRGPEKEHALHLGRGWPLSIITDGKLFLASRVLPGVQTYAFFNNEVICGCGRKGCLRARGVRYSHRRRWSARYAAVSIPSCANAGSGGTIRIDDIIEAAKNDDNLDGGAY